MDYNSIVKHINEAIDYYDPIGLLEMGAPKDEYIQEAKIIASAYCKDKHLNLNEIIIKTFQEQFEETLKQDIVNNIEQRIRYNLEKL